MMHLFYAAGGGLGHISRTTAFIQQLDLNPRKVCLLSNSTYAIVPFIPKDIQVIPLVPEIIRDNRVYREFLLRLISEWNIQKVYLDAFPAGLMGEWNDFPPINQVEFCYLARILKWEVYEKQCLRRAPHFENTYLLEPITGEQRHFIEENSRFIIPFTLDYPKSDLTAAKVQRLKSLKKEGRETWLIIHSEPEEEVEELFHYAQETARIQGKKPYFILSSQSHHSLDTTHTEVWEDIYPAYALFPWVDRIVSACGFNTIQQTRLFRDKHIFIPFHRKYDDQFLRARLVRENYYNLKDNLY
ncbi:MAG: hypothetical protein NW226_10150 [Microscillaceae bacterium]|nr:hypothetical protein [Microscillaceae bacterium]